MAIDKEHVCIGLKNVVSVFHHCLGPFVSFRNASDSLPI